MAAALFNDGGTATLTNVTLAFNSADHGGGIYNDGGTATLTNTTLSGNLGFYSGGGISNNAGTVALTNSIVAGNDDAGSSGDEYDGTLGLTGGNIVGKTLYDGSSAQPGVIELTDIFADVDVAPVTGVLSGVLADNGGPVETIALNPDLANPAIDSGTGALPTEVALGIDVDGDGTIEATPISVDARGFARDVDFDGFGGTPDLGAFEQQNDVDLLVTTLDDGTMRPITEPRRRVRRRRPVAARGAAARQRPRLVRRRSPPTHE